MAFHKFIKAMLNGKEIVIYGDGNQTRDFTFIDDIVEANVLAMDADIVGEVFNVGGGARVTVGQIIKVLEEIVGDKVKLKYIGQQKGDVRHTTADISKAREYLEYVPKWDIKQGLQSEFDWISTQREHRR